MKPLRYPPLWDLLYRSPESERGVWTTLGEPRDALLVLKRAPVSVGADGLAKEE